MRTTIEIADDKLIKVKKLAAERGERGFSGLVDEALAAYLDREANEAKRRERQAEAILNLRGAISDEEAEETHRRMRESRAGWRRQ